MEMIKLLLAHGADVNARTKDRKTALAFAVARNHHDAFELLKRHDTRE
ncbi:MAG: ankyrin repeat domain-containing protein [Thermoproteota archaeon]